MKSAIIFVCCLMFLKWWFTDPTISAPGSNVNFSYIVKYAGNSSRNEQLPMLVALHGNGDTTSNFYETALDQINTPVRIILLEGPLSHGSGSAWPWTAADFSHYGEAINDAIGLLTEKYPTLREPILLGFSGGGMMAYYQAAVNGRDYSAIFPISGQLSEDLLGGSAYSPGAKVYAFHGKKDKVVSFGGGRTAVELLRKHRVRVNFVEFDGGHHGIFTNMKPKISQAVEKQVRRLM